MAQDRTMWLKTVGLVVMLALAILVAPRAADAQPPGRVHRIGCLSAGTPSGSIREAFRQGLREFGYTEGQNIVIEYRDAEGRADRLPDLAAELVRLTVDVIVAFRAPATRAAKQATTTIPIVMVGPGDPVREGLVASLARPGGNVTGLSSMATELSQKRLELLKEALPGLSRVAVLWGETSSVPALRETEVAARALGVQLQILEAQGASPDLDGAFQAASRERADALIQLPGPLFGANRIRILELTAKSRLPAIYEDRAFVEAGGLMSYGPSLRALWRRSAYYVDSILKGAKPGDVPVERPMLIELVINLKTAKALGLTIPPTLLFRADEVIQ